MPLKENLMLLLLTGLTETGLVHIQLSTLLKRRKNSLWKYLVMLGVYFATTIFDAASNFQIYYIFIIAYLLIAMIAYLFYDGTTSSKLSMSFVCIALNYSATIFSFLLVWAVNTKSYTTIPANLPPTLCTQLLLFMLTVLLTFVIYLYGKLMSTRFLPTLVTVLFVPFIIFFLIIKQYYYHVELFGADLSLTNYLVTAVLLFLIACMLYSLNRINDSLSESLSYSATLEQMLAVQEKYYTDLQKHQLELRHINHDIKSHTRTIVSLLESGQTEEVMEYANSLQSSVNAIAAPVTNCDNMLINALLNDKLGMAKQDGVELRLCVMVPAVLNMANVDLCILLGNLLDNAAEACAQMGSDAKRFIDVDIRLVSDILCIDVSNPYKGEVKYKASKYFSTKDNSDIHGLGLSNVKQIVSKYNGRLNIDHDNNIFSVSVYISCGDEDN